MKVKVNVKTQKILQKILLKLGVYGNCALAWEHEDQKLEVKVV